MIRQGLCMCEAGFCMWVHAKQRQRLLVMCIMEFACIMELGSGVFLCLVCLLVLDRRACYGCLLVLGRGAKPCVL